MAFQFKQFSVEDQMSSMRIGTDAILLGSWADVTNKQRILEIGTGCGVIAMMMAQRSIAHVTAIDIHEDSVQQATENFRLSPWDNRLTTCRISLDDFIDSGYSPFDMVICNPPFFHHSLKSPLQHRNMARHASMISHATLPAAVSTILNRSESIKEDLINGLKENSRGTFNIIIPAIDYKKWEESAIAGGGFVSRKMWISPKPESPPNRVLIEFCYGRADHLEEKTLMIRNRDHEFTEEYKTLTSAFYLKF
ncbi:MAG: methyltransferase [Bacteroidota bacterium]